MRSEVVVIGGYPQAEGLRRYLAGSISDAVSRRLVDLMLKEKPAEVHPYQNSHYHKAMGWENALREQARVQQRRKTLHKFHEQKRRMEAKWNK